MAEGQVLIKDLPEATSVEDSSYIPVDNGTLTQKISVENFNDSSNQTAKGYAEQAQAAATTATEAIADVNSKVDAAQAQANIATTQAGYAQTYAGNAQTYAGNAQGYANAAQGSATNAAASASAASSSADAANDNATLARSWAEGNTGARVDENTNNARYWANKAQTAAQQTIDNHLDPQSTNPVENQAIYNAINALHTGGSNIVITTTEVTLRGQNCTITDGTTSYTEAFDLTGKAVFEGVQITGAISISSTDGTQTATDSLTVPYFGNYTKSIAFWRATIAVTTNTTEFNGLTVSAKKGGVVMGTGTFSNGSASIVVPSPGTYKLEVTLDWKTFESDSFSVSAETTYNETIDGFVAPISLSTPTTDFYGASIAVILDGDPITPATPLAFDNTGAATFDALQAGVYLFTLTYGGEPYTATVTVSAETSYSAVIKMWTATVNLSTSSTELLLQTIVVKKNGIQVGTTLFSAGGTASYIAHEAGTYVFECTYDSYPFSSGDVVVSAETTYSATITAFTATLSLSTLSAELYSKTITIKKGSTTVGTTAFSSGGTATYRVHETGTYTAECEGYSSGDIVVSSETTYNAVITAGLDLATWISAGSTTEHPLNPSSYADFAALEADEEAIRQLMTVHNAVDYLAQATAGDSLMESVIGSDVCAKWINLRDYALDTLYANSDIASEMDTADKYGYGDWVKLSDSPETWGAKGNVPIMTADNAPYGTAIASSYGTSNPAFRAFDDSGTFTYWQPTNVSGAYIGYKFTAPICPRRVKYNVTDQSVGAPYVKSVECIVKGSNDGTWEEIDRFTTVAGSITPEYYDIDCNKYYESVAVFPQGANYDNGIIIASLQFYGRELKPLVPVMTSNTTTIGSVSSDGVDGSNNEYKAFDGDNSTYYYAAPSNSATEWYLEFDCNAPQNINVIEIIAKKGASSLASGTVKVQVYSGNEWTDIDTVTVANYSDYDVFFLPCTTANITKVKFSGLRVYYSGNSKYYSSELHTLQFYGLDYSEKEFASGSTRKTIYDHGVELVALDSPITAGGATAEKQSYQLYGYEPASGTPSYAFTTSQAVNFPSGKYSRLVGRVGNTAYGANASQSMFYYGLKVGKTWSYSDKTLAVELGVTPATLASGSLENGVDISSVTGDYFVMFSSISNTQLRYASCEELWLE